MICASDLDCASSYCQFQVLINNPVTTLVHYWREVVRLAFRETPLQLKSFNSGDFHVHETLRWPYYGHATKRPPRSVCFHFCRWPPVPHSAPLRPPASLLLPCPKRSRTPRREGGWRGYIFFLFQRLRIRMRSQCRPRPGFLCCRGGSPQTQSRHRPRLSRPDSQPIRQTRRGRIRQRFWV